MGDDTIFEEEILNDEDNEWDPTSYESIKEMLEKYNISDP